ncbi:MULTISPECIES: hypothetical protein [Halobacterium]|uniref:hypothetical protein n=1 Tax=Halobacterium TaxID=2239 RepID=UPI0019668F78|nr:MULTISPECIES: hypothetical protein [Halobacterium]MDL0122175.1 hypothetical protein [Halobacterium salinarum]QRY23856.1 hypothetical protein JRZ79_05390 [Halobacterium sp. BOL4-2]
MSRRRSGGVLAATGDVLSAFLSIAVVVGLPLSIVNDHLGSPLSTWVVKSVVFVTVGLLAAVDGGLPSDPPVDTAVRLGIVALSFCVAALYVRHRERTHVTDDDAHGH